MLLSIEISLQGHLAENLRGESYDLVTSTDLSRELIAIHKIGKRGDLDLSRQV